LPDATEFADPDSAGRALAESPAIHPTAQIRDTVFGIYNEIGPHCRIAESSLGDYSYVGDACDIIYTSIGKFCSIAAAVRINPGNHPLERAATHHFTYRASKYGFGPDEPEFFAWRRSFPVAIGHDVWIGHGAILLPGVTIGTGAVIGAGALVTRDVEPYSIVIGHPARHHRHRFPAEIRGKLLQIAWWNWPPEKLKECLMDFRAMPIEAFCARHAA
jgi:phosphonate metabolism protein (transferase hexapeptide repeat family)